MVTDKNCFDFQTQRESLKVGKNKCRIAIYGGSEKQISDFTDYFYYNPDVFLALVNDCGRPFKEIPVVKGSYFKKPLEYDADKRYALMDFEPEIISEPNILKCPWGKERILFVYDLEGAGFNPTQRALQHLKAGAACAVIHETGVCYSKVMNSFLKEIVQADIDANGRDEQDPKIVSCIYECLKNGANEVRLTLSEDEFNIYSSLKNVLKYKKNPYVKNGYIVSSESLHQKEQEEDQEEKNKNLIPFDKIPFLLKKIDGRES